MKKNFTLIILSFAFFIVDAQDFHLSQYDGFSMYLNPALTGNYLGSKDDYKIYAASRTQWRSLGGKPFSTYGIGYDMKYKKFGVGSYLLNNRAGIANFNTLNFQLSGSYFITDPENSPHLMNAGLQMGFFYKSFNPNKLLFESQYDYSTGTLNPEISSGEIFQRTNLFKLDVNIGFFYKYAEATKKIHPYAGFSLNHLSIPKENFISNTPRLPMRLNLHGGCDFIIDDKTMISPNFLYMSQAKASELNLGVITEYKIKEDKDLTYKIQGGLNYRWKDAIILQLGISKNNIKLRMSYDINTSYLRNYSNGRGAFELGLQIGGKNGESPLKKATMF